MEREGVEQKNTERQVSSDERVISEVDEETEVEEAKGRRTR